MKFSVCLVHGKPKSINVGTENICARCYMEREAEKKVERQNSHHGEPAALLPGERDSGPGHGE